MMYSISVTYYKIGRVLSFLRVIDLGSLLLSIGHIALFKVLTNFALRLVLTTLRETQLTLLPSEGFPLLRK